MTSQTYLNESVLKVFVDLTEDRIDAVRVKANELLIEIVSKNPKEWCDQNVIPKVFGAKENLTYIKKQHLLDIIEKTCPHVSEKAFKEIYQPTLMNCIIDKVANVRVKSMKVLKANNKLLNSTMEKYIEKMKDDKDHEVRDLAKKLRA